MLRVQFDLEILYVQKLYYFMFLATVTSIAFAITLWSFGLSCALGILGGGLALSYLAMLQKKNFNPPERKLTAKRMAQAILKDTSPLSISRFASQLYYYFHAPAQAISLLEKYLPSNDPLLCTTLGEILLKEGKVKRALYLLRDNPYALVDPLLLATQGRVLKEIGKTPEAVRMLERSLHLAKQNGFPRSGAHWLAHKLLTISYRASIHHTLADSYVILGNIPKAKQHYHAGNLLLFDLSLWRKYQETPTQSAKITNKSR